MIPARWMDTEGGKSQRLRRKSETGMWKDCEDIKAQGVYFFPLLGVLPWSNQIRLFLCYSAVNKSFYGMSHLRLCCGKSGAELLRKPGLTV